MSIFNQDHWRSRSRSRSRSSIFSSPLEERSRTKVVAFCKFRCYITEYCCIVCVIAAMCNIQCRTLCCVLPGTTALLSVLCSLVAKWKVLVCQDTWRQYEYGVYRVCCMLSAVCQVTAGMQVRLCMHDACMPQTKWNNMEKENGIKQRSVQQNCIIDVTAVDCRYCCVCHY